MPDAIYADPRLARLYDIFDGDRDDLTAYLRIAAALKSRRVLDIGCGTGSLAVLLAEAGATVTAVDPALASLLVARHKPGAERVRWVHGNASALPDIQVDAVMMTGNVAQVFLSEEDWSTVLRGARNVLAPGGHLVFEVRRLDRRVWEEWAAEPEPVVREVAGIGAVEQRLRLTKVDLPYVSFRHSYNFPDGTVLTSASTLRFRTRREIQASLYRAGFVVLEVREAPDRPGREYVFIARVEGAAQPVSRLKDRS